MPKDKNFITKETYERLKLEREKVKKEFAAARYEFGETRTGEGAWPSHDHAHEPFVERLYVLGHKLDRLNEVLESPTFIESSSGQNEVQVGSTVEINLDGQVMKLSILGSVEAGLLEDVISAKSPLAQALLGRRIGDEVKFEAPSGFSRVKVLSIK